MKNIPAKRDNIPLMPKRLSILILLTILLQACVPASASEPTPTTVLSLPTPTLTPIAPQPAPEEIQPTQVLVPPQPISRVLIVTFDGMRPDAIEASYAAGVTDEFIEPAVLTDENGQALATIAEGDTVICFNFRTDRCRQITRALTQEDFADHDMHTIPLHYVTMTRYDHSFKGVEVIFENEDIVDTIGEVLERNNRKQIRIAETEKYPHVTFFFSGGREKEFTGETRIMRDSPKVATYDLQPEMSAFALRDAIIPELEKGEVDFVCLNFANADMVGHTGVFEAAVAACEAVDTCVGDVVSTAISHGYDVLLTADHGNSDLIINEDGSPNTAHTTNPVPLFYISSDPHSTHLKPGKLGDLAPTLLTLMGLDIPEAMTGEVLLG